MNKEYEAYVDWKSILEEGNKLLSQWDPKYDNIKNCVLRDHLEPKRIPQFSINSYSKLQTEMQINLHSITRFRAPVRRNCHATKDM